MLCWLPDSASLSRGPISQQHQLWVLCTPHDFQLLRCTFCAERTTDPSNKRIATCKYPSITYDTCSLSLCSCVFDSTFSYHPSSSSREADTVTGFCRTHVQLTPWLTLSNSQTNRCRGNSKVYTYVLYVCMYACRLDGLLWLVLCCSPPQPTFYYLVSKNLILSNSN